MTICNQYLETVTRHDDLFTDHRSEIDHLSAILYRSDVISIHEWIDMRLPGPFESSDADRIVMLIIAHLSRECIEYHRDTIIDRDDADIEFEGLEK